MKIFNIKRKENMKNNLKALLELSKRKLDKQKEELKKWEKTLIEKIENIELKEETEYELYDVACERMQKRKDMIEKITDLDMSKYILEQLIKKYGDK